MLEELGNGLEPVLLREHVLSMLHGGCHGGLAMDGGVFIRPELLSTGTDAVLV